MNAVRITLASLLLAAMQISDSTGQCIDYDDYPTLAGGTEAPANTMEIVVAGDYAYLTSDQESGLIVADISDPAEPEVVGFLEMDSLTANGLATYQNYVYVANYERGVQIVDVTNPSSPVIAGNWDGSLSLVSDVIVYGHYLCVFGSGSGGLRILNISAPTSPVEVGSLGISSNFNRGGMAIVGSTLYIADGMSGLAIVNLQNPAAPTLVKTVATYGAACDVVVDYDGMAYVANGDAGVCAVDVSYAPTAYLRWALDTPGRAMDLALLGSYLMVAGETGDLQVIDRRIGFQAIHRTLSVPGQANAIAVKGGHAFLAAITQGLQVVDIRNYAGVGEVDTESARSVFVRGDYAYVGDSSAGLKVIDVSDPSRPAVVGSVARQYYWAEYVTVAGDYLYWDDSSDGMIIADISNPSNPTVVSNLDLRPSTGPDFVAVQGDYAYVPRGTYGLQIIDISDKAHPIPIRLVDTPGSAMGLVVDGNYAYLADKGAGLQVVDISNPATAAIVGNLATPLDAYEVHRNGARIYVTESNPNLETVIEEFDISTPGQPARMESISSPVFTQIVGFSGPFVYALYQDLVLGYASLAPVLMSDPLIQPDQLVPYYIYDGYAANGFVYLVDHDRGLRIFPVSCDATYVAPVPDPGTVPLDAGVSITSLHPNPFNPAVQVAFELPESGSAILEVHDVQGRLVQSRSLGRLEAGRHVATWNGLDRAGHKAPSGVYFVRLRSGSVVSPAKKVVMLE